MSVLDKINELQLKAIIKLEENGIFKENDKENEDVAVTKSAILSQQLSNALTTLYDDSNTLKKDNQINININLFKKQKVLLKKDRGIQIPNKIL